MDAMKLEAERNLMIRRNLTYDRINALPAEPRMTAEQREEFAEMIDTLRRINVALQSL